MTEHESRAVVDLAAPSANGSVRIAAPDLDDDASVVIDDLVGGVAVVQPENRDKQAQLEGTPDEHRSDPRHRRRRCQLVLQIQVVHGGLLLDLAEFGELSWVDGVGHPVQQAEPVCSGDRVCADIGVM